MRVERGFALLATILANQARDPKTRPTPFTMLDFMPHEEDRPISLEEARKSWA